VADLSHIYLVVHGSYNSLAEEHWQYGIRFLLSDSGSAPATSGTLPLVNVDLVDESRTETDWTIRNRWKATSGLATFQPDDWLNDQVAPALVSHFGAHLWGDVKVDGLKASPIGTDGKVVELATCVLDWTTAKPSGDGSTNPLPTENTTAISLRTPRIGPRGRGRVYYPVWSASVCDAQGRLADTPRTALLAEFIAQLEGMSLSAGDWWVLPIVTGDPWTQYGEVTEVRVGNVIDTQRRRRRQEPETYISGTPSY
jgi:hypothetical protein